MIDAIRSCLPGVHLSLDFTLKFSGGPQLLHFRAEVGSPTAQTQAIIEPSSPTFPQFMKLPPEIRIMIWKLSFGPGRIFRTKATSDVPGVIPMAVNHKPPAATQACKEARFLSLQIGKFLFGSYGSKIKSLWFNPSRDLLYWSDRSFPSWQFEYDDHDMSCIKFVAIDHDQAYSSLETARDISTIFPGCRVLQIVLPHKALADDGDVGFSAINEDVDDLSLQVTYKDKLCRMSWKSLENTFYIAYEKLLEERAEEDEEDEASRFTEEHEIPSFYPVEVTLGNRL
ncbi:hypothetical protein DER45DRAFT_537075 [Fusarium avenaceum]|nr:hypothetical protein DER45DRAFT_537075 [Fusarium avenaceum]